MGRRVKPMCARSWSATCWLIKHSMRSSSQSATIFAARALPRSSSMPSLIEHEKLPLANGTDARDDNEDMTITLEAVYENGVLRPLSPLALPEHARVRVVVDDMSDDARAPWLEQSERSLTRVWDNPEDDVFNALLTS